MPGQPALASHSMEPAPPAAADSRASMAAGRVQDLEMALMKRE